MNILEKTMIYNIFPGSQKDKIFLEIEEITKSFHLEMYQTGFERSFIVSKDEKGLVLVYKEWTHFVNRHRRGISYYVRICNDGTIKSCNKEFIDTGKFAKAIYVMFRSKWQEQKDKN
jgi:hypothetical protein